MAIAKKPQVAAQDFPFHQYLHHFYEGNKGTIKRRYKKLSLKFLDYNDPGPHGSGAFLRRPQFEALEMYVFLKEFTENQPLWKIFKDWSDEKNGFDGRGRFSIGAKGQFGLFEEQAVQSYDEVFRLLKKASQAYPNYIYALTMGLGKTILMATCIFYEFLLANKFPKDARFCHNALVFAPDKTVLHSLKEIQTFDKSKVVPPEYVNWLDTHLQFHFLDDTGLSLNVIDRSKYNIIISNTQKIILKKQHKAKSAADQLFAAGGDTYEKKSKITDGFDDLYDLDASIEDEADLLSNQRFAKLTRLEQLGIYIDEAHHAFGDKLAKDMGVGTASKTSLRTTVDELAAHLKEAGTQVVACYNYTGTPYVGARLLPEIVYAYGLKEAIANQFLKRVHIDGYSNTRDKEFLKIAVSDFWKIHSGKTYEGMLPKMAIFAGSIEELTEKVKPALESVLIDLGIPTDSILINVGDSTVTTNDDLREFYALDTVGSEKQFILLVGKGKEGWNCRSLFGVALYREPKSKVFVLQATMRCLRAITNAQQTGRVYLSDENLKILNNELEANFRLTVDEVNKTGSDKVKVEVRPVPPPVKITLKRVSKLHQLIEKFVAEGADLELDKVDTDRYRIIHKEYDGMDTSKVRAKADLSYVREQHPYSELTLVAEIARYLNKPPTLIRNVLASTKDGTAAVLEAVNEFNEVLYDHVVPRLFREFYDLKEYTSEEDYEVELVKEPTGDSDCYVVSAKPDLIANFEKAPFSQHKAKSFHLDHYCFDSTPEREFFWKCLQDGAIRKIWFTGMLTHGQSDFVITYIDPVSNTVRSYYPDFLVQRADGSYVIVEVKGDNKVDDLIVQAKDSYARQLAASSGFTYQMIPGTKAKEGLLAG
ncbi:DEAD/DEAH box helicase family protein [Luteolibacter sp. SL250]|uniref:TnsA endonuclease N-terminal domain-containing protein n=1 Tax=Luteolibacter sp. SL250 TaxID=2995170 RepID=UPI00226D6F42|nr:TnsA endonuclease N-terminal domain-containing protein [Luteolibacter sp. SL250]WAC19046.1 DEAD/DEAH box helicase family protein [Luteolibacter sp. SL250]